MTLHSNYPQWLLFCYIIRPQCSIIFRLHSLEPQTSATHLIIAWICHRGHSGLTPLHPNQGKEHPNTFLHLLPSPTWVVLMSLERWPKQFSPAYEDIFLPQFRTSEK